MGFIMNKKIFNKRISLPESEYLEGLWKDDLYKDMDYHWIYVNKEPEAFDKDLDELPTGALRAPTYNELIDFLSNIHKRFVNVTPVLFLSEDKQQLWLFNIIIKELEDLIK